MSDVISAYRAASEESDPEAIMALLASDAELVSPISGRMVFRGSDDLLLLFSAVYGTLKGLHWSDEVGDGSVRVLRGTARVGPFRVDDAMLFELAENGRIRRISPHFRPWLGLTVFALVLGVKMARHPGVILRALRRP